MPPSPYPQRLGWGNIFKKRRSLSWICVCTQNIEAEVFGIMDKNWVVLGRMRGLGFVELIFYFSFAWAIRFSEKSLTEKVHIWYLAAVACECISRDSPGWSVGHQGIWSRGTKEKKREGGYSGVLLRFPSPTLCCWTDRLNKITGSKILPSIFK